MSDLNKRDMEQLRGELDALRLQMVGAVEGVLARVDEVLVKLEVNNRQMFADLQAQTRAGFASLQACIDALSMPAAERKHDDPSRLN